MDEPDDRVGPPARPGGSGKPAGAPRGPSSAQRGEQTRRAVLDAALVLIAEVGWGAVTTRAIAARAGVPHGAVSYHFAGKDELLRESVMTAVSDLFGPPIELAGRTGGLAELLTDTIALYGVGMRGDPSVGVLAESLAQALRDEPLRERLAAELRAYRTALADLARSEGADADADAYAAVLAALLDGLLLHVMLDPALDVTAIGAVARRLFADPAR